MIEIGRNNIVIRNVNTDSKEYKILNNRFSLFDSVKHQYTFRVFTIIGNDIYLPGSIGIEAIQQIFPKKRIIYNYKTSAKSEQIDYSMRNLPRDDLQKKALEFLYKISSDNICRERLLSLPTGSGKTYVTINLISRLKKRAMIIVDTIELAAQWKRSFIKHSTVKEDEIIILSGSEIVAKEEAQPSAKIYIAIHRTLNNLLTNNLNSINKLMNKLKIGIRVFDESHTNFGNICRINSLSNVHFTIFLSATPSRSNYNDNTLYGKVFKQVPYFNGKELQKDKYHTVIMYKMNTEPDLETKLSVKTKYGFSTAKWANYLLNEGYSEFFISIKTLIEKLSLINRKKKTAIMLPTIELLKKLKGDLKEEFGIEAGTFIGEIKPNKRLDELSKQFILTNDKIFDKAIDVEDLEILINYVSLGSAVKTEQIMGRLRYGENKSSILVDVVDEGFEECVRQSKLRKRLYKKKAKKILELEK